ncbi:MAG TPA: hypothetical protein VL501_02290, partial [Pyrinomonadaceae bacterium]|nr:hypothetical protein [Pyrinomonadaceae bacterium]
MKSKNYRISRLRSVLTAVTGLSLAAAAAIFVLNSVDAQRIVGRGPAVPTQRGIYHGVKREITVGKPMSVKEAAKLDLARNYNRPFAADNDGPGGKPEFLEGHGVPIAKSTSQSPLAATAPVPSASGVSAPPMQTFKGEYLSSGSIPPDTHGAVGTTHIVTVSNDRMRIQTRDGVEISRATLTSFWSGVPLPGGAAVSAFDPKILFDRFNGRFIFVASANAQDNSSSMLLAVSQTSDPTGSWFRYSLPAVPNQSGTSPLWIDYPSVGFNKNWITINENVFQFNGTGNTYARSDIYAVDKQAAYNGTLGSITAFQGLIANCASDPNPDTALSCGFTMAPAVTEDNTTDTEYIVEDWDAQFGQLRMSKLTGTPASPVLTVGTSFPQSTQSWRFSAARIGTTGGYAPQRQQSAHLVSGTRIQTNDSRIQNVVLRNGSLWTTHTVMLSTLPQPAGTQIGGVTEGPNRDNHSAVQWWQIDPTQEPGTSNPAQVLQRGRIEDPTADNCHNGTGGTMTTGTCTSTAAQVGTFFAFPNISVNQ